MGGEGGGGQRTGEEAGGRVVEAVAKGLRLGPLDLLVASLHRLERRRRVRRGLLVVAQLDAGGRSADGHLCSRF